MIAIIIIIIIVVIVQNNVKYLFVCYFIDYFLMKDNIFLHHDTYIVPCHEPIPCL